MYKISKNVIIGENVKFEPDDLKEYENSGLYLLCVRKEGNWLLEMFKVEHIFKKMYDNDLFVIIGVASGSLQVRSMTVQIIEEYLKVHETLDGFKQSILLENEA